MPRSAYHGISRQRGSALLFALAALIIIFLGTLFTLRGALTDAGLTNRFSERQKNIQASDLAQQWVASQIKTTAMANEQPLEISGVGQQWYLSNPLSAPPGSNSFPNYWTNCETGPSSTDTCAPVPMPGVPEVAYAFVQPTGRTDTSSCGTRQLIAMYYDIWVHTVIAGSVATDTESLYKLCLPQQ